MQRSLFKQITAFIALLWIVSCTNQIVMNSHDFDTIELGMQTKNIIDSYGNPQRVYEYDDGSEEYEYTQRIMMGKDAIEYNRFFFLIRDGQIISKRYHQDLSPSYREIYRSETDRASR